MQRGNKRHMKGGQGIGTVREEIFLRVLSVPVDRIRPLMATGTHLQEQSL